MEHHGNNHLEEWLDNALREHGNAEPRPGLEKRVLAKLNSAANDVEIGRFWLRGFAAAAVAGCVTVSIWIGTNRPARKWIAVARTPIAGHEKDKPRNDVSPSPERITTQSAMAHRSPPKLSREPRLAQFPSSQPLSEQEQLLARYVQNFPQEARIVAGEQARAENERQLEELAMDKSFESNSDQRER